MKGILLKPRKSLNKAYLKVKPNRADIEVFKANLTQLIDRTNDTESEEHHKNLVMDFLKKTYYDQSNEGKGHFINTKGRTDLVIHNGKEAKSPVGVLVEAKKPNKKTEMVSADNLNAKSMQELVLYYLRERILQKNLEVKHLVITNIYEWYLFDVSVFEKNFAQDKKLVKQFEEFEAGRLVSTNTDFFYKEIARAFLDQLEEPLLYTHFDLRDYERPLRNNDKKDDAKLIALYKLLSPEHMLKLPFANDSNSLDKSFYGELLHIIGLEEVKDGGKKIIQRKADGSRNGGALLENAVTIINERYRLDNLEKPSQYGSTTPEREYNVALELCITWINRILFLKLLESQLIAYHRGDRSYAFLNSERIPNSDTLDKLFFSVLAKKYEDRNDRIKELFANIPYLNSSLFESTELERRVLEINQLDENILLPIWSKTVLKNEGGKRVSGDRNTLAYLFDFLDAFDFSSEGAEAIQEDNKSLINASVLGLIFEKINGYKDGSFFTPGFITMYMCRETIRRSVVQKVNDAKGWQCKDYSELKEDLQDYIKEHDRSEARAEFNKILNSLKICDPAVGSGHFLVSALNEMIAIKSDLKILVDRAGERISDYDLEVVNDELVISDIDENHPFVYHYDNKKSHRLQEALFHEKQTIIENCLFGVDINPNSVKICRLRLWIELLKNAYYVQGVDEGHAPAYPTGHTPDPSQEGSLTQIPLLRGARGVLETLPNIDINIKCGNSLISRFDLDADIKEALKKSKWSIDSYRTAVDSYRNAKSKEEKREMERLIADIKGDFRSEISKNDKQVVALRKKSGELAVLTTQTSMFEMSAKEKKIWNKKAEKLTTEVKKLETIIDEIKNNKIYENAFEWRFEFPEVLSDDGDFVGFDTVIGNPPYGVKFNKEEASLYNRKYEVASYQVESYILFIELSVNISSLKSIFSLIIPEYWTGSVYDVPLRKYLLSRNYIDTIVVCPKNTFEDAVVETCILQRDHSTNDEIKVKQIDGEVINSISKTQLLISNEHSFSIDTSNEELKIVNKVKSRDLKVEHQFDVVWGVKVYQKGKGKPPQQGFESKQRLFHSSQKDSSFHLPLIGGKEVGSYSVNWRKGWIKYGEWLAEPREKSWFMFKAPSARIYVREVTSKGKILAAYSEKEFVFSNSIDGMRSKSNDKDQTLSLTGILNSKLISFFHLKKSGNSRKVSFPKILIGDLKKIGLPEDYYMGGVAEKVTQILDLKKADPVANTTALEKEIDQLVYALYDLAEEEIKIVEESVG